MSDNSILYKMHPLNLLNLLNVYSETPKLSFLEIVIFRNVS